MRVLTIGTFDLLHEGHMNLFYRCADLAGELGTLTVGVNSDAFATEYKVAPHDNENERINNIEALNKDSMRKMLPVGFLRVVLHLRRETTSQFILAIRPEMIVVGSDWATKDYMGQLGVTQEWMDAHDISVCYVPYTKGVSSTELRKRASTGG